VKFVIMSKKLCEASGPPPVPPLVVIEQLESGFGLAENPKVLSPPVAFLT
jgi:hypothetical protein